MEKDFIEFLDHVYEPGYGLEFKENNPSAFYQQLERFNQLPKIPKYETSHFIYHRARRGRK